MAEPHNDPYPPEDYREPVEPTDPPNSVLRPQVRRAALWIYLGPLVAITVFVGLALLYWSSRGPTPQQDVTPTIGTAGEELPGGFKPGPHPDTTSEELERRGAGSQPQGPMSGLGTPVTNLGDLRSANANGLAGRRVEVQDVRVADVHGRDMFWVEHNDAKIAVIPPSQTGTLRAGSRVDISGMIESDGRDGVRIRATQVHVR